MFDITDETRADAIEAMREILLDAELNNENLGKAFDTAVAIVKQQFGL